MRAFYLCLAITACVAAAPAAPEAVELEREARALDKLFAGLEKAVREIPRDRFEPQSVIETVGRDPMALFEWVKSQTDFLPYRGALRGPSGVLMDRGGNSLDRSLLLAELLRGVGYSVRLANAKLPSAVVAGLMEPQRTSRRAGAEEQDLTSDTREARQRVVRQADRLIQAYGALLNPAAPDMQVEADLSDHWWVQWLAPGGTWSDLDVAAVSPGQKLANAERTLPISGGGATIPLDAKDAHEVELRVVIEVFRNGKLEGETVHKHTFRPAETLGRGLSLTHFAGGAIKDEDLRPDPASVRRLKAALTAHETYLPVLRVGDRPVTDASFTTAGKVERNPTVDKAGKLAGAASKTFSGFGGALGGDDGATATEPAGVLTGEWIEYEVRVPGRAAQIVRREVFDLVGPAARQAGVQRQPAPTDAERLRRALRLLGETQILLQPCDFSPGWAAYQLACYDLKEKQTLMGVAHGEYTTRAAVDSALSRLAVRDEVTPVFAVIRHSISPSASTTFIDRPNIVHHRIWLEEGPNGELVTRRGMDMALTSTSSIARLGGGGDAFLQRLSQGVADTLAEHLVLGPGADTAENAVGRFEDLARKNLAPLVVRGTESGSLATLGMPPNVLARAAADLAAGHTLIVAGSDSRWAWWRVDPLTGQTVGVMDNGYNSAFTERQHLETEVAQMSTRLGHKFTTKQVEKASKDQIIRWAGKDANAFRDLMEIQAELSVSTLRLTRFMAGF